MNKVEILVRKKYCEGLFIKDPKVINAITFEKVSINAKGNAVFSVRHPGEESFYYEVEKVDLSGFSKMKALSIPKQYRNDFDIKTNKAMIANWINRHTGHALVEEDIAYLIADKQYISVVIAADSMRFNQTSIQLIRL